MDKRKFKNFVDRNKLESHWSLLLDEVYLIVPTHHIAEFQKIVELDPMNEHTLECTMGDDYFCIEVYNFLTYEELTHEEIINIFPNKYNNV